MPIFDTKGNIPEGSENWTTDQWADHYYNLDDNVDVDPYVPEDNHTYIGETATCQSCFGEKVWCSGCQMYTATCCEEYGTCMCSQLML